MVVPEFMVAKFFPKAAKDWYNNVNKFYTKNHKNLWLKIVSS